MYAVMFGQTDVDVVDYGVFVHVFTSLFLDRLLQLPKVWMVLEMSVRVRETSGSLKGENGNRLNPRDKKLDWEMETDMQQERSVTISVRVITGSLVILEY